MENNKALLSAVDLDNLPTYDPDREMPGSMELRAQFKDGDYFKVEDVRVALAQARLAAQPVVSKDEKFSMDQVTELMLAAGIPESNCRSLYAGHQVVLGLSHLTDIANTVRAALAAPVAAQADATEPRPTDDHLWDATLRDRDTYHEWADKLADSIAAYFGVEIGEHSNMNLPWAEALEAIENADRAPSTSAGEADTTASVSAADDAKDAARFRWMASHRTWHIRYRVKNGKEQWQMLDDGESWGQWGDYRKVIDAAMSATKQGE